jgi:alpha-beta hydrolase superfamily lysophospholipase
MVRCIDFTADVTAEAELGEAAYVALTVHLPDPATMPEQPIVCFAKPGGGYSRGYFTVDLPGPARGAQASWHAARGWIFVSVDHLGVGNSSQHAGERLDYTTVAAGNMAAEREVLRRLAAATVAQDFPAVAKPVLIGIGQSMGGCMTIVQQGRYHCYDGVGVLGYSPVHTHPPTRPGEPPIVAPWLARNSPLNQTIVVLNQRTLDAADAAPGGAPTGAAMGWGFHYDDIDPGVITDDLSRFDRPVTNVEKMVTRDIPPWASLTFPTAVATSTLTPGTVAPEAAAICSPVLIAMGERDVVADPKGEPRAYLSANSVDLFICPRMGHMHNFAGTRELFWRRIETWSDWVRTSRRRGSKS